MADLTRAELDAIEEHVRLRNAEGGFTNVWNADALKMAAWIRSRDKVLKEIEGLAALPVDHPQPLEHSCCAVSRAMSEKARDAQLVAGRTT